MDKPATSRSQSCRISDSVPVYINNNDSSYTYKNINNQEEEECIIPFSAFLLQESLPEINLEEINEKVELNRRKN